MADRFSPDIEQALRLLAAEDARQAKLHELLETIREQIRLEVAPEHRPEGLFQNIQDAVYAMRGRTPLMNDAAITAPLRARSSAGIEEINQIVEQAEWYASVDANAGLAFYLAKHWPQIRAAIYRDPAQAAPDRAAIIEECANAVVFCGECDCPAMSKKAILALSITSTDRQNMVASDPSPEKIDPKPEPLL